MVRVQLIVVSRFSRKLIKIKTGGLGDPRSLDKTLMRASSRDGGWVFSTFSRRLELIECKLRRLQSL